MVFAVLVGPILAVQVTRWLDDKREVRERKLAIFKTLMATRGYNLSIAHVEALNRIDLEFGSSAKKEAEVVRAWKAYLDILNDGAMNPDQWWVRRVDLFVELLHKMALVLDYDFDKTHIKNSAYSPTAHGQLEEQQKEIREGVIKLLRGEVSIPIRAAGPSTKPD